MLHLIEAAAVGGMERLLLAYLATPTGPKTNRGDSVLAVNRGPAGPFMTALQDNNVACRVLAHAGPFRLPERPKTLRQSRAARLIRRHGPAVLWNRLPDRYTRDACRATPTGYYDHGLAWYRPPEWAQMQQWCAHAIACSHASARMLRLHWDYTGPIAICPNPDPIIASQTHALTWRGDAPFVFGVAARLTDIKGVILAIEALAVLVAQGRDCRLIIAGEGPATAHLRERTARLAVAERVSWLGRIRDMHAFYRRIHCLVHPALHDAGSLVLREASSAGCPVVATHVDGMPEWFGNEPAGQLVVPRMSRAAYAADYATATMDLPPVCYDPDNDRLTEPKACFPADIAHALARWYDDPAAHARAAASARRLATTNGVSIDTYTARLAHQLATLAA
ncbi:glycosyltransferase [Salinisphaera sp. Q1T1-3]|uniref:glycosyltransferase n=1 Tax=Salinisphaera sp. Q1T1-3 TaxID=2321229 RepID=UPI000E75B3A1|nr:glycosyltransferase [Salinisphaera sp. Q1T1-3]RJS94690.1 glycosyltransferase [Salinisphaera sp. Q1T1-3]